MEIFELFEIPLDKWISDGVKWMVANWRPFFQAIRWPVDFVLSSSRDFLLWLHPIAFLIGLLAIAWRGASWRVGVFGVFAFLFVGYIGLWEETMVTLALVLSAVLFCVVVGIPTGIFAARNEMFAKIVRPILDTFQTTPAFVYLVPVVMLFSIGNVSGVIATIVFAIPPIIRLTNLGIRQVPEETIEAATAFGSTPREILWKVQAPLAMPTIMAGLNQTIMLALSMVVFAAVIGAGGLGVPVFRGLNTLRVGLAAIGGIAIVLMAMVLDRITQGMGEKSSKNME